MASVNVRYVVDDVNTAVAFYTTHLDSLGYPRQAQRSLMSRAATSDSCSAVRPVQRADRWLLASVHELGAGTGSNWSWMM